MRIWDIKIILMKKLILFLFFLLFSEFSFSQFESIDSYFRINSINNISNDLNKEEYIKKLAFYSLDMDLLLLDSISKTLPNTFVESSYFQEIQNVISWKKEFIGKKINLNVYDSLGNKLQISNLQIANKYLLLDVWASWCIPCINDFKFLLDLRMRYSNSGVEYVFLSIDEKKISWLNSVNQFGISKFVNLIDKDQEILSKLKINTIPKKILLDNDFNIIGIFSSKMIGKINLEEKIKTLNNTK